MLKLRLCRQRFGPWLDWGCPWHSGKCSAQAFLSLHIHEVGGSLVPLNLFDIAVIDIRPTEADSNRHYQHIVYFDGILYFFGKSGWMDYLGTFYQAKKVHPQVTTLY